MQEHSWLVHLIRYTLNGERMTMVQQEVRPHGSLEQPPQAVRSADRDGILAREVLRLAQREADLQGAIDTLASQLFAARAERDSLKNSFAQADHRASLWQSSAEKMGEMVRKLEARTAALERENRDKCQGLAEKAEEVRSLNGAFELANEENDRHIARIVELERENERLHGEVEKLARDHQDVEEECKRLGSRVDHADRLKALEGRVAHIDSSLRKYTGWLEPSTESQADDCPE